MAVRSDRVDSEEERRRSLSSDVILQEFLFCEDSNLFSSLLMNEACSPIVCCSFPASLRPLSSLDGMSGSNNEY